MRQTTRPSMGIVEVAGIGLAILDQPLDRLPWRRRVHHHDLETFGSFRDPRTVLDRVVTGIYRRSRDHCERARVSDHRRIAIRGGPCDRPRADRSTRTTAIFDDHRLSEPGRKNL